MQLGNFLYTIETLTPTRHGATKCCKNQTASCFCSDYCMLNIFQPHVWKLQVILGFIECKIDCTM